MKLALRHVYYARLCVGCNLLIGAALSRGFGARLALAALAGVAASVSAHDGKNTQHLRWGPTTTSRCSCESRAIANWLYTRRPAKAFLDDGVAESCSVNPYGLYIAPPPY